MIPQQTDNKVVMPAVLAERLVVAEAVAVATSQLIQEKKGAEKQSVY